MRLIDADALRKSFKKLPFFTEVYLYYARQLIDNAPTIEERKKGKWIFSGVEHSSDNPIDCDSYYCSVCKRSISTTLTRPTDLFPFCHCGADMRKEDSRESD